MKKTYLIILLLLVACGKKQAISYKEYHQKHEQTRERHIQLIETDAEVLDTLFSQDIDYISGKIELRISTKDEFLLDIWDHSSEYLKEADDRHQIYSHEVVYNDKTREAVQKMWTASSDLMVLDAIKPFDIQMDLMDYERDSAVIHIKELRASVSKAFAMMKEGAEEYQKIVFGDPKQH